MEHLQMRAAARVSNAKEVRSLVHRQSAQPADLVDERPLTLFFECVFLRLLTTFLLLGHEEFFRECRERPCRGRGRLHVCF